MSRTAAGEVTDFMLMGGSRLELDGRVVVSALTNTSVTLSAAARRIGPPAAAPLRWSAEPSRYPEITGNDCGGRRANFSRKGAVLELAAR